MGTLTLVTGPTTEPVRLSEVQLHLRVDDTNSDPLLAQHLRASRQFVEDATRRALVTQTWDVTFDYDWPTVGGFQRIDLPLQPVQSVTSITYVDEAGATQTLGTGNYALRNASDSGLAFIEPAYDVVWPAVRAQAQAVTVRFVAGYGAASDVPDGLKTAILFQTELLFDRNTTMRELVEQTRDALLSPYRVTRVV